jgi:hypothetical protein
MNEAANLTLDVADQFSLEASRLGIEEEDIDHLKRGYAATREAVANSRAHLGAELSAECVDVVGLGSMGRYEMSQASDLDFLVICNAGDNHDHASEQRVADELRRKAMPGVTLRPPGKTGLFGGTLEVSDLYEIIGLDEDTNPTHSRRVLVLEESVSLSNPAMHDHLLRTMANRYIDAIPLGQYRVPRFLVNDLARYWRQLTVDYQAKSDSEPSSLRRLKLIGPRKFTYASSILALLTLELRDLDRQGIEDRLVEVFKAPPSLRFLLELTYLKDEVGELDGLAHGLEAVRAVNEYSGLLADPSWRAQIESAKTREASDRLPEFQHARSVARRMQESLEGLFFSSSLEKLTKKDLVF